MLPKPKKSLGQNFLVDPRISKRITGACHIREDETIVEIGPGSGALTGLIAEQAKKVIAIEIDNELFRRLSLNFANNPRVEVIRADFLGLNPERIFTCKQKVKVVGNIPYYITTPIIERLLEQSEHISSIWLTVQKEYARRICAKPCSKEYGSLTCFIRYYTKPKIEFDIKSGSFYPKPKVDSTFVSLEVFDKPPVEVNDKKRFFSLIRSSFAQKRKTLKNNLKDILPPEILARFLDKTGLSINARAEELSLQDFATLSNL